MNRPRPHSCAAIALTLWSLIVAVSVAQDIEHPGRIVGLVVDAANEEPISDAYVGTGDFGDAGGTNLSRFAKQGRYVHTRTDENGRFFLENVAIGEHPLVVTHREFVRHDQMATARAELPETGLRIKMKPAANIHVTVVDAEGEPLRRPCLIRLEALDGHVVVDPAKNPHVWIVRAPHWTQRTQGTAHFAELAPGEYSLDVVDMHASATTYHSGVARVRVESGETKELQVKPVDHRTTVTVEIPAAPDSSQWMQPLLIISRNPALALWHDGKVHNPEDARTVRLMHQSLAYGLVSSAGQYQIKNLPPGVYSVFVGPLVALQGAQVTAVAGVNTTADIVWRMPELTDYSEVELGNLHRQVKLDTKSYTAEELCELLTAAARSKPRLVVDDSIQHTKLQLTAGETPIWDVLEAVYLDKGWKVDEQKPATLVLRPGDTPPGVGCSVAGSVVDAENRPVAEAAVLLCRQATGMPFAQGAKRTLSEAVTAGLPTEDLAHEVTDAEGRFAFGNLQPGRYRLVAQSWRDAESIQGLMEANGQIVELRGVAENVTVSNASSTEVVIRPLGTGVLRLDEKLGNDPTVLAISTAPPRADAILGFIGWEGPFVQGLIGGNRMLGGKTTVYGLPEGEVHVALFVNKNAPSFGVAAVDVRPENVTDLKVPMVPRSSDGRHDPPERLLPLVTELETLILEKNFSVSQTLKNHKIIFNHKSPWIQGAILRDCLTNEIQMPSGANPTLADFITALAYLHLQESQQQPNGLGKVGDQFGEIGLSLPGTAVGTGYANAFAALHTKLGSDYPCFELKGIDWNAVGKEFLPRAKDAHSERDFALLCAELVARLEDSHACLIPDSAEFPSIKSPRWDSGFACLIDDRGKPVVYHVDKDQPAEKAGVRVGMTVLSVGGEPVANYMKKQAAEIKKYRGYSSDRYLRYHLAQWLGRRRDQGEQVEFEMQDAEGEAHKFNLTATVDVRYLPRRPVQIAGTSDTAGVSWTMLEDNVGYIYVRRIGINLIESLDQAVSDLKHARGIIVDVRGNSGGGFDNRRAHRNFTFDDAEEPDRPRFNGPIALLIDARCISAGEGWASWFIAEKRAQAFGEATAGASSRKTTYSLTNGLFKVCYSVRAYHGSLDRPIERRGLEPDVKVSQNANDLAAGRDTVFEAAKEYLLQVK